MIRDFTFNGRRAVSESIVGKRHTGRRYVFVIHRAHGAASKRSGDLES